MPDSAPLAHDPAPRPAGRVTLHTLGECRVAVQRDGRTTTLTPASDRLFTLALLLAAEPGRPLPRARAAAWLWPDVPRADALHALRQLVYRLRRLGAPVDGGDAHLVLAPQYVTPDGTPDALPPTSRCLPDWRPAGDALEEWVDRYRARTEAGARAALVRALEDARDEDRDRAAIAASLLEIDPHSPLGRAALPHVAVHERPAPAHDLPFVGRDALIAAVRAHAAAARQGRGTTLALTAAPGAGATRTLAELASVARAHGLQTLPRPATPPDPADGPVPDATPDAASNVPPNAALHGPSTARPNSHPDAAPDFAGALATAVLALLDRPGALGASPAAHRTLRRLTATRTLPAGHALLRRLGAAVAELARAVAAERPLLLLVATPCITSADRLVASAVARDLRHSATLAAFVVPADTARADSAPLGPAAHAFPLAPLDPNDAARLATRAARARGHSLSAADLAWCVAIASGRPADAISLAHRCATAPGSRALPPSIAYALHDRLSQLRPRTRAVAALGALVHPLTTEVIAHALGRHDMAVAAALADLRRAGLPTIVDPGAVPDTRRDPARRVTRDAARTIGAIALTTLAPADRELLERQAARGRSPASRATQRLVASRIASTAAVSAPPSRTSALPVSSVAPRPWRATTPTSTNSRPNAATRVLPSSANDAAPSPRASASSAARAATSSACTRIVAGDSASPSTNASPSRASASPRRSVTRHDSPPRADRRASTSSKYNRRASAGRPAAGATGAPTRAWTAASAAALPAAAAACGAGECETSGSPDARNGGSTP